MSTHPRDHVLCQAAALAPTMTDVTKVTVKVRVNGGAATTYSSTSSPAVAQDPDCLFGYHVEHPVNSFADGDRVSRAWLYNNVPVNGCYGDTIIGPSSVDGAHYTNARGDKLDDLDAAVSTRLASGAYTAPPTSSEIAAEVSGEIASDVWDEAAAGHVATGSFGKLMAFLDVAVSSRSTYAGADTAGTTTLLSRLSTTRAGYLDNLTNLDAAISAIPAAVWNALTSALTTVGSVGKLLVTNVNAAISSRLAASDYTAPDNLDVTAIKTELDALRADYTTARAALLDKLNVTGNVASSAEVTAIQNNTLSRVVVPDFFERPDAGSDAFVLDLYVYDETGTMQDADSTPALTVQNESGTDRSGNLSVVTRIGAGHYRVTYTLHSVDPIEQLRFEWTIVVGGATRLAGATSLVVDTTAVDFTAADRTNLVAVKAKTDNLPTDPASESLVVAAIPTAHDNATAVWANPTRTLSAFGTLVSDIWGSVVNSPGVTTLLGRLTSGRATKLDNLNAAVGSRLAASDYTRPDNAGIAAIKAQTDDLPADPASEAEVEAAVTAAVEAMSERVWVYHDRTLTSFETGDAAAGYPDRANLVDAEVVE